MSRILKFGKKINPLVLNKEEFTHKIGLTIIGISLVIILLIISSIVLYAQQKRLRELQSDGLVFTKMVTDYSLTGIKRDEAHALLKIINDTLHSSELVYGMIMDASQQVIAHTDTSYEDTLLTDPIASRVASSNNPLKQVYTDPETNGTIHEFSRPIYHGGQKIGAVRLGFSQGADPLFSSSEMNGLYLIAVLVFSLVPIFYYLVRRSMHPLEALNDELKSLLEKNEFNEIPVNTKDGIGKLVDRFNKVIARHKDQHEKLHVAHDDIEIAHRVLSYEKERIESVIDSISDGIMVTDSVGSVILVNQKMALLMKISEQDVLGKTVKDCIHNEDILSFIEQNQIHGGSFVQKNLELSLKQSGRESIVHISHLPLLSPEESVLGNIIIATDTTAARLAQYNQSDFIANVSNELKTPLTTIKSYVELLMEDEQNNRDTKTDFCNKINDEANLLSTLINNLLNISKIEMGSLTMSKDLIKTREFFEDVVTSIEAHAISKKIKLKCILPDTLPSLVVDKELLRVAIVNILGNAIKYTPEGGSVTLKAEESEHNIKVDLSDKSDERLKNEHDIKIDISDTGYGISKKDLPHIFDKFFRSSDENLKEQTGNGLGLALSREIIILHDGAIDVSSDIGQGTHFTLTLPVEGSPRTRKYNKKYSSLASN